MKAHIHTFMLLCRPLVLFMKPSCDPASISSHAHTRVQMCLLAMKKLSVLICSLRPEDKSDHGDGGCLSPPAPRHTLLTPQLVLAGPAGTQVALEAGPPAQLLLSAGLRVPKTSPMPRDRRHRRWSDIKTNREE